MMKETDIFNDDSLQNDIHDLVAIEQAMIRAKYPLPDVDAELENIIGKEEKPASRRPVIKMMLSAVLGAAAMLTVVLLWQWRQSGSFLGGQADDQVAQNMPSASGMATIQTAKGELITLTLADGTEVKLNEKSKMVYPHEFKGKQRMVYLEGEAFFKVRHDTNRPFLVEAGGIITRDLGTSFNVCAYSGQDCKVTLVEGSVAVLAKGSHSQPVVLSPGQQFSLLQAQNKENIKSVDTEETTAWADGVLYFHDQTLEHVVDELAAYYNVQVDFRNQQAKSLHLDFSADKKGSVAEAIALLNDLGIAKFSLKNRLILVE